MSGLEYLLNKGLSTLSNIDTPEPPKDFKTALGEFLGFCDKQLPILLKTDFLPVCFDISKNEETIIIGGKHGNIGNYDKTIQHIIVDEEICPEYAITTVLFVLNEQQVAICNSKSDIYILDFPKFKILNKIELNCCPLLLPDDNSLNVVMKLGSNEEWLYYCKFTTEIEVLKLSGIKNYYTKNVENYSIKTHSNVLCIDVSDDGTLIATGLENGKVCLIHADTHNSLQSTSETENKPIIVSFSEHGQHIAAGFENHSLKVWHLDKNFSLLYEFNKHTDIITGIAFAIENRYLVTSSADTNIII